MKLSDLPKITQRSAKRIGRGIGSGKGGHTAGRGTKGQKARTTVRLGFEGTKMKKSLIKRLPFLRGKGKFKSLGDRPMVIKLGDLQDWPKETPVTEENLEKAGLIPSKTGKVKILADGEIKIALTVRVPISGGAKEKVVKAGGKIEPAV